MSGERDGRCCALSWISRGSNLRPSFASLPGRDRGPQREDMDRRPASAGSAVRRASFRDVEDDRVTDWERRPASAQATGVRRGGYPTDDDGMGLEADEVAPVAVMAARRGSQSGSMASPSPALASAPAPARAAGGAREAGGSDPIVRALEERLEGATARVAELEAQLARAPKEAQAAADEAKRVRRCMTRRGGGGSWKD
jgi:hypothetical protein